MKDTNNTIIFTGHFDIGETISEELRSLVEDSKKIEGIPLILVGDVGISEKVVKYILEGIKGLISSYYERMINCSSDCISQPLPKNDIEIENRICKKTFDLIEEKINSYNEKLCIQIKNIKSELDILFSNENVPEIARKNYNGSSFHIKLLDNLIEKDDIPEIIRNRYTRIKGNYFRIKSELDILLNNKIVPEIIRNRIEEDYKINFEDAIIIREKWLRNRVIERVNKKRIYPKTWTNFEAYREDEYGIRIGFGDIVNPSGYPLCRGIMFAFFEELWAKNISTIYFLIEERHFQAISKGYDLFEKYHPVFNKKRILFCILKDSGKNNILKIEEKYFIHEKG